jgi:uncharacterized membrane protein
MRVKQARFWKVSFVVPCLVNAAILGAAFLLKSGLARLFGMGAYQASFNYIVVFVNGFVVLSLSTVVYRLLGFMPLEEAAAFMPFARRFVKIKAPS